MEEKKYQCFRSVQENLDRFDEAFEQVVSLRNQLEKLGSIGHLNITDAHIMRVIIDLDEQSSILMYSSFELRHYAKGEGYFDPKLPRYDPKEVLKYNQRDMDAAINNLMLDLTGMTYSVPQSDSEGE